VAENTKKAGIKRILAALIGLPAIGGN